MRRAFLRVHSCSPIRFVLALPTCCCFFSFLQSLPIFSHLYQPTLAHESAICAQIIVTALHPSNTADNLSSQLTLVLASTGKTLCQPWRHTTDTCERLEMPSFSSKHAGSVYCPEYSADSQKRKDFRSSRARCLCGTSARRV
jgi:hypothetical protein